MPYERRQITVTTCAELYKEWRSQGKHGYKGAPTTGIDVTIDYIHTGLDRMEHKELSRRPLMLILTGAPGNYRDFSYTIPFLDRHGVDVVCPVWPNIAFSRKTNTWWHSGEEKAQLIIDFLQALNIKHLDMVTAHSSGAFPAVHLAARMDVIPIESLALFSPAASNRVKATQPYWFMSWIARTFQNPYCREPVKQFFKAVITVMGHPLKKNMEDVMFSLYSMIMANDEKYQQDLVKLGKNRIPALVIISDNDKLIDVDLSLNLVKVLGGDPNGTWYYDEEGQLARRGNNTNVKTIQLSKGSHYGFSRYSNITNPALLDLMDRVPKAPRII